MHFEREKMNEKFSFIRFFFVHLVSQHRSCIDFGGFFFGSDVGKRKKNDNTQSSAWYHEISAYWVGFFFYLSFSSLTKCIGE